jgi:glycosyltransferase involved in cell wall biosynthesis
LTTRISILLPIHDAEETLESCLRSIERQSETRWECVMVDDGSQDRSSEIAAAFADRDARFRLLRRPHEGLIATLTAGLDSCSAPFIARMDADDLMRRERLALQRAALEEETGWSAVGSHVRAFPTPNARPGDDERGTIDGRHGRRGRRDYVAWLNSIREPEEVRREAFVECPIAHPTLFIRGEVLRTFGYRDRGWAEDYDLILRLLGSGHELGVVPQRLLAWRDAPARLSRREPRYDLSRFIACKAAHLSESFLKDQPEYILWGYGETGRRLRKALLEYDRHPSHIVELHPRRIGNQIHEARVIAPEQLPEVPKLSLLVSVAGLGPRTRIREALGELGYAEGNDYVCTA